MRNLVNKISEWLWGILLVLLPISSMPLVVKLVGSDTVAAPSGLFLFLLVLIWLIPYLLKDGILPRDCIPFLFFIGFAVLSTFLSAFLDIPTYNDINPLRGQIVALLTLGIGLSFYLLTTVYVRDEAVLLRTLRIINWSGLVMLVWAFTQWAWWTFFSHYPEWMREIHALYSIGPLYRQRATGFAVEPSWLAHQLNMLYLPIWMASTIRSFTAHKWKFIKVSFENLLLVLGIVVLFLTFSRVGLIALFLMIGYLLLRMNAWVVRWLQKKVNTLWSKQLNSLKVSQWIISASIGAGLFLIYMVVLFGVGYGLSRLDPRMKDLFTFSAVQQNALLEYAHRLNFDTRLVYWQAAWNTFNDYPWLGVGLGNVGFFFPDKLGSFAWKLVEVRNLIYRSSVLLNSRSLWLRLLAETGLVGFSIFIAWLASLWVATESQDKAKAPSVRMLSLFGKFVLLALLIEGFSVDSFALPYIWIALGLATAASHLSKTAPV
jgi:uncharacterized membrane protein (DUF485 family)